MARRVLGPATLTAVQAVVGALADTDRSLLIACSGGPDSLALAAAAAHVARQRDLAYGAVVVDHGLQPDSAGVAERTRAQLGRLDYADVLVDRVAVDQRSGAGPEASARAARYQALDAAARSRRAVVLLGHTLDDQAETVLLGLARGSGVRSLAGMAARSGHLLRPFLGLRRAVTEQVCAELGLEPWLDPHNGDPRFARVRVRDVVLPALETQLGPGVAESLARTAQLARADADLLDTYAAAADPGTDTLDCADLLGMPAALRSRVLRRWLLRHGAAEVAATHLLAVDGLVTRWRGQGATDLPGVSVARHDGALCGAERLAPPRTERAVRNRPRCAVAG